MKLAGWWLSPGRRRFELRPVEVPWLWVERDPFSHRTVIWGGHPDRDVWVGSTEDRSRERARWRRVLHARRAARQRQAVMQFTLAFQDNLTPALQRASVAMAEFGKAYAQACRCSLHSLEELGL